jgi:hypothetical protein
MICIEDLENMDRAALVATWSKVFKSPAPKGIGQTFLRRFLAFELQAGRSGGLSKKVQAALGADVATAKAKSSSPGLKPGGRLIREWNGVTHIVDVTEEGFVWNGQTWRSLSVIAREITGAHWSGPRFFGLKTKARS